GVWGADRLYLTLDGPDGALRGRCWVQIPGGRPEVHDVAGAYDAAAHHLTLDDLDQRSGAGHYELTTRGADRVDGQWSARRVGPSGEALVTISARRVAGP
ncbi:MAG TPA: hypothetical protein PKA64_26965, partial [Myxococcota bacterium]|nr:hypothetical protein [Myxococcota bacterium]